VLFRLNGAGMNGALVRAIVDLLPGSDPLLTRDIVRLEDVRARRAEAAAEYFRINAGNWEHLRALHVSEEDVETAVARLAGHGPIASYLDLGTGTGRILKLLAPIAGQAIGIDSSREMLAIARSNLEAAGLRHAQVRHGDINALPFANGFADLVTIHQVLHYLDEPGRAIGEAARVLRPGGRLIIVDFAPHDLEDLRDVHAHRRLGLSDEHMKGWLKRAGLQLSLHEILPPPQRQGGTGLTVSLWLAEKAPEKQTARHIEAGEVA
jgi:ubiquinone/menaquinone biosynthesis C-methylase UbiE